MTMAIFALLGAKALYLTLVWLASAIAASWLSLRAGYGEKSGLCTGLILSAVGVVIWLIVYAAAPRAHSRRKADGLIPKRHKAGGLDIDSRPSA
jgi:hypothetical protein